jgi:ABC-type glycerol-3-phosphate transport system substrate-binding protein
MHMLTPGRLLLAVVILAGATACIQPPGAQPPMTPTLNPSVLTRPAPTAAALVALQTTPTPDGTSTATSPTTHPDVTVWWPAALMPDPASEAAATLQAQFDSFRNAEDMSLLVRTRRLDGTGGIMSTLHSASAIAPAALPDLVLMPREQMIIAAETGLIYPLDDLISDMTSRELYPQALLLGQIDDQQFGLPYTLTINHAVYRETVFDPPPTTFDAILSAGQPFALAIGTETGISDTLLIQYLTAGGRLVGDDGRPALDEIPLLDVLTFYEQAAEAGLITSQALAYQQSADYWPDFLSGIFSLAEVDSDSYLGSLSQLSGVNAAPIPTLGEESATVLRGWMWVLTTADPDRQRAARDYLDWMMRTENQAAFTEASGLLPSQRLALRSWDNNTYEPLVADLLASSRLILPEAINQQIASTLQNALAAVLSGEQSATEATAEALLSLQ